MKRSGILVTVVVLAACLAAVMTRVAAQTPVPAAQTTGKVAVCDIAGVFNNYERAKDLSAEFEQRFNAIRAEDQTRLADIQKIEKTLDALAAGSKEYEAQMEQLERMSIEQAAWRKIKEQAANRQHRQLTEEMYKELLAVIEQVARQRGFELVLHREDVPLTSQNSAELLNKIAQRRCLYADPAIDITQSVLDQANRNYRAGKGRP